MIKEISYTSNPRVDEKFRNRHLIPYRITPHVKYEAHRWYYSDYWGSYFNVITVKYNRYEVLEEAYIKWEDGNYGLICTDLDIKDLKLKKDFDELYKKDIINSGELYTGAEIVYWFFMNNIDCFNRKYKGFWKYLDTYSAHRISDFNKYMIVGDLSPRDIYCNCKLIKQKSTKYPAE